MINGWFPRLPAIRSWPRSLLQSTENPIQLDRLPRDARGELEYPTQRFSVDEDRRHTIWLLLIGPLVAFIAYLLELLFHSFWVTTCIHGLLATVAIYVLLIALLGRGRSAWRWPVYFFLIPLAGFALCLFRDPYLFLALGLLLAAVLADRFATHYFFLKTTVPMARRRSRKLRRLWRNRFRFFTPAARGVEFYKLAFIGSPCVAVFLLVRSRGLSTGILSENILLIVSSLAMLLVLPLLLEAAVAFLFERPYVHPKTIFRAFRVAVVQWFTYNRHGAVGPCIFQSPVGTYRERRRMSLAAIVLFATAMAQLFSYQRELSAFRDRELRARPRQARTLPTEAPSSRRRVASSAPLLLLCAVGAEKGLFAPAGLPATPPAKAAAEPTADLKLEPYQEAMLRRMPPEERAKYVEKLQAERAQQEEQRKSEAALPQGFEQSLNQTAGAILVSAAVFLRAFLLMVVCPALCAVLPPLLFLACCFSTSARVLGFYGQELGTDDPERLLKSETWDDLVRRIRVSGDKLEKDSLLLGVNAFDDTPVIVPRAVFNEHAHLLGDSGSGKTSLGLASLITQFIRFADCSVVILDLKGDDLALFEDARIEAAKAGLRFRWFTNELDRSSYVFNPLTQKHMQSLTLYQRVDVLTSSMGLQYGTDYGRGYFSAANAELLHQVIQSKPDSQTFAEILDIIKHKHGLAMDHELRRAASHLEASVSRLADCESLNTAPRTCKDPVKLEHAIDFSDVFLTPQVVYFSLPSAIGAATSAEIARMALYAILSAAKHVGTRRAQVYLFIDEFQRIVAHNLELILQTARSMNIAVILANQTLSDLKTASTDLIPTVRANTRFKQIFAASDLFEQQSLIQGSGETLVHTRSWNEYVGSRVAIGNGLSMTASEFVSPRLRVNDILLASDHPQQSIVCVTRGKDYAQFGGFPFVMTSAHHITFEEYSRRRTATWPPASAETIPLTLRLPQEEKRHAQPEPSASPPPDPVIGKVPKPESPPENGPEKSPDKPPDKPPVQTTFSFHGLDAQWSEQQRRLNKRKPAARKPAEPQQPLSQPPDANTPRSDSHE